MGYVFQNGRSYDQAVTVAWQLRDVEPGLGGFACVPGSHKAFYPMPPGIRTCDDDMGLVVQPVMKAGDVLFFGDGATTQRCSRLEEPHLKTGHPDQIHIPELPPQWRRHGASRKPMGRSDSGHERCTTRCNERTGPGCRHK